MDVHRGGEVAQPREPRPGVVSGRGDGHEARDEEAPVAERVDERRGAVGVTAGFLGFGADDLRRVVDVYGPDVAATTADGHPALDLPAGVRAALDRAGIADLHDVDVCTAASPDHFSYRRDGRTGRQAVVAVLDR